MVQLRRTTGDDPEFLLLVGKLSATLAILNGEMDSYYSQNNRVEGVPTVVVAAIDCLPVGCGAFRSVSDGQVEIKRMFVEPEFRGKGISRKVLAELESWAAELGANTAVLETSRRLLPALSLYASSGYSVIPNYGPYVGIEDSVCMEKSLA